MFRIASTNSFDSDALVEGDEYDYVTRTSQNQGILCQTGFVNNENINPAGTWSLGLLQMDFFYRRKPWYAGQFVRKVFPKIELNNSSILFFSVVLNKLKPLLLNVLVRNVDETFLNEKILLPTKDGKIDYDFINGFIAELEAQRIAELEAQRIAELEAYLTAAGLKDYVLTEEEVAVLEMREKWEWGQFNLERLFGKSTRGKRLKSEDRVSGPLPFVTAGEACEGVSSFIGNKVEVFSENTTTIDMFGSAKYRNYKYGADDHVAVVHTESLPRCASLFVTAAIHKSSHSGKFDYSLNFYAKDADELEILLPVNNDALPDYKTMNIFIRAIEKLVIKDVVEYADSKIAATKQVVDNNTD